MHDCVAAGGPSPLLPWLSPVRFFAALATILALAIACAPAPAPPMAPVVAEAPKPVLRPRQELLPPASPAATLMEASCVRMGSVPMQDCSCWSRRVAVEIDADVAAAYGIQNIGKRADAMTALKPDKLQAFQAAAEKAEAACARHG